MTQVTFKFEGGSIAVATYPEKVVGDEHSAKVVDWINTCYFALESSD